MFTSGDSVKFICSVANERRVNVLEGLLTNMSGDLLLMALACFALDWNPVYRLGELLKLLNNLYGERYYELITELVKLSIFLAKNKVIHLVC